MYCEPTDPAAGRDRRAGRSRVGVCAAWGLVLVATGGCRQEMADQPRLDPFESSALFQDGMAARPLVPGTVPRGHQHRMKKAHSAEFLSGLQDGEPIAELPAELLDEEGFQLEALLRRGLQRYEIYCSHCHDLTGSGQGMVPHRGFPQPATFHSERLRAAPLGYVYRVITLGRGPMPAHGPQIPVRDRWAIAAYIRALQLSQQADLTQLPDVDAARLPSNEENEP